MRRFALLVLMTACGMPAGLDTVRNNPIDPQADPAQQRCGNGIINSGEECDDGNTVATDGCTEICKLAICGDGHIRTDLGATEVGFEECDDGNQDDSDDCVDGCTVARVRCGDGVIQPGEECDAGETASDYCTECVLKRCDAGCFDALDPESTDHCVRVPVPGGQFVNACLPAQGAPTAVPAPLGVCRSGEGDLDPTKPCARDDDCEDDSYSCDIRPAWNRCVTSEPNRLHGFLQSCIPDEGDCSGGLLCSPMVAKKWHGFCDAGESPDGWHLTGYQTQIPGSDEVVCYPSACEGAAVQDSADQPISAPVNACPHLNDFNGQKTQNTYCAAGSDFTQAQLTSCLWEECRANADDQDDAEEVCDQHQAAGAEPARCTRAEVCGYASDDEDAPAHLLPLDLTHPFNLVSFEDRCSSACMFRGATCTAVHDGLSPVAQAQCMVCDSDDCCPEGTFRATGRDDHFHEVAGLCLSQCFRDAECGNEFRCDIEEERRGFCVPRDPPGASVHDGRTALMPCESHTECADSLCLPIVTWRPDSPKVCQLKSCRNEWDCPITQNCGGGRCRQDILCGWGDLSCGSGAMCTQTQVDSGLYGPSCQDSSTCEQAEYGDETHECQWGACGAGCDEDLDCGEHQACVLGFCISNRDFGTCRLPSLVTSDAEEPVEVLVSERRETFSEGFMLDGDTYREFRISTENHSGLWWLEGSSRSDIRCNLELDGQRLAPLDIGERFNVDMNQCSGWFGLESNQTYTLRVRLAEASDRMWRRPTQVLLEMEFVPDLQAGTLCLEGGELDPWEGCVDADPNDPEDGCVDCRCTPPREFQVRNWNVHEQSYVGCHHGRRDALFEYADYQRDREQLGMAFVVEAPDIGDEMTINCWVMMRWNHEDEDHEQHVGRDEERSTANRCVVFFEPDRGYRAEFFAVQEGEFSGQNPEVTFTVGQRLGQGQFCAGNTHNVRDINLTLCLD